MEQLLCHLFGDYVLQNHWMAQNKIKAWLPAIVHVTIYAAVFLVLQPSAAALAVIWGTHLVIDRFYLAKYWVEFYGVGSTGWLWSHLQWWVDDTFRSMSVPEDYKIQHAHDWLAVWLRIIVDNTFHLTINFLALKYL